MAQASPPQPQPSAAPSWIRRKLSGWSAASIGAGAVLVIFIVQNTHDVTIHFLVASFSWPLWLYTIVVAAVGAVAWIGLGIRRRHRRRRARREERGERAGEAP